MQPAEYDILIQIRRDTVERWTTNKNVVLYEGELAAFYTVRKDANGNTLYHDEGQTEPVKDKHLYTVVGNGRATIAELQQGTLLFPVSKGAFNSVVSNRAGTGRNLEAITSINATHRYETLDEALDALFHPYASPAFTQFEPSSYPDLEIGLTYNQNKLYSWNSSNVANVKSGSVMISQIFNNLTTTLAAGLNGQGSLTIAGQSPLRGMALDQTATFRLTGRNSREAEMSPINRTQTWKGKAAVFLHDNAEWLIDNQRYKQGEVPGTYQFDDNAVIGYMQQALNGANSALASKTHQFGNRTVDGGNTGKRLYLVYPKGYRTSFDVLEPVTQQSYSTMKTRELTLNRNGVDLVYVLAVLELKIVQNLDVVLK